MADGTHPLWPSLSANQDSFVELLQKVKVNIEDPDQADDIRQWIGEARSLAKECLEISKQIIATGGHLSEIAGKYNTVTIADKSETDALNLYESRIATLDGYAKEESLRRARTTPRVPWGGLYGHETTDGKRHLILEHIGQTYEELELQLGQKLGAKVASSFFNLHIAEWAVADLLAVKHNEISIWLKTRENKKVFHHSYHRTVGYCLFRNSNLIKNTPRFRVVLIRYPSLSGYKILTGFPEI